MKCSAIAIILCSLGFEAYSLNIHLNTPKADCTISVNKDLGDPQTLVLIPGAEQGQEWAYPQTDDIITVQSGANLQLACPGGSVLVDSENIGVDSVTATCVGGLTFATDSTGEAQTEFSSVSCTVLPKHVARYTGVTCENNNKEIEIGFEVSPNFIKTITVCFDSESQNTIWSKYTLTKTIGGHQSGFPRPSNFNPGNFYNVGGNVDDWYKIANQRVVINQLLGLPDDSTKYIGSGDYYMSRGHLTANADFVFGSQQRATFWFVNVAPQWQTFNGRNWMNLESNLRDFQAGRPNDILVYTGTYGVATLPHESTSEEIPLYLYVDGNERGLPVPEVYWKVAYDPVAKAAIAFVGANNPYKPTITPMCTNICDQINWLTWNPNDVVAGFSYCCDVRELREVITFIPDMDVTSVLA